MIALYNTGGSDYHLRSTKDVLCNVEQDLLNQGELYRKRVIQNELANLTFLEYLLSIQKWWHKVIKISGKCLEYALDIFSVTVRVRLYTKEVALEFINKSENCYAFAVNFIGRPMEPGTGTYESVL
jgi:hypothetical protein